MKKSVLSVLSLILVLSLLLTGCELGQVQQGVRPSNGSTVPQATNPSGQVDANPFTVTLTSNGEPFKSAEPITIQWSNDFEIHTAVADENGIASVGGLDGDYQVTLKNIPTGYTYNPNIYVASNYNRSITIDLQPVNKPTSGGYQLYSPIKIDQTGVYYIELAGPTDKRYFEFAPKYNGTYAVESWMDVTANEVNPLCDRFLANFAYREYMYTQDDGGAASTYTKNFKLIVEIADENISTSGTGAVVFTFAVYADRKEEWPKDALGNYEKLKIYIDITRNGGYDLERAAGNIILPQEDLEAIRDRIDMSPGGQWHWAEDPVGAFMVLDNDSYKLWPVEEGGDGVYHRYDPEKYPETGGYGPVLFAKISSGTRYLENPLTTVEYAGNKALTVDNGDSNYKLFIEGWEYLNYTNMTYPGEPNTKPPYFCDIECPCRREKTCTSYKMGLENGTCETGCTKCLTGCRNLDKEAIGMKGYGNYCVDGAFPVTEELKQFLQKMAISQLYFRDGDGWCEVDGLYAAEDAQWLWDCGYYE